MPLRVIGSGGVSLEEVQVLVDDRVNALVDAAPATLNTLNELAAALGDDENFGATVTAALAGKSDVGHAHAQSDVAGLVAALAGKAPVSHPHDIGDVVGLSDVLAGAKVHSVSVGTYGTTFSVDTSETDTGLYVQVLPTKSASKILLIALGVSATGTSIMTLKITDSANTALGTWSGIVPPASPVQSFWSNAAVHNSTSQSLRTYKLRAQRTSANAIALFNSISAVLIAIEYTE